MSRRDVGLIVSRVDSRSSPDSDEQNTKVGVGEETVDKLFDDADSSWSLPEDIYGAGMAGLVCAAHCHKLSTLGFCFGNLAVLIANIFIQAGLLYQIAMYVTLPTVQDIRETYDSYHDEVFIAGEFSQAKWGNWSDDQREKICQFPFAHREFFWVILVVWTMWIMSDLRDTLDYTRAVIAMPRMKPHDDYTVESDGEWVVPLDGVFAVRCKWEAKESQLVVGQVGMGFKFVLIAVVLLPKFVIACSLWIIGSRWLMATASYADLILNALALGFITDFDELLYSAVLSRGAKSKVQKIKLQAAEIANLNGQEETLLHNMRMMTARIVVAAALPYLYVNYFQQVIPHYKFDINKPCREYYAGLAASTKF